MQSVVLTLLALLTRIAEAQTQATTFYTVDVFDRNMIVRGQTVSVEKGMIVELHASPAAPPKGPFFQGKGKTLLPGLIDAHCHIASVESLEQAAALGVTTEFDMFGDPKKVSRLRRELDRGGPSQRGRFPHCGNGGKRTRRAPE